MIPYIRSARRWAPPAAAAAAMIAGLGLVADRAPALALVNESPSLPRGLYVRDWAGQPSIGAIVAVPQPPGARAYLGGLGMPGEILLIKRVAARGGDRVCRGAGRVTTPDRVVVAHLVDRNGAALPQWRGCRLLDGEEVFLLGETPDSFDSRYFGPVRRRDLQGVFVGVVSW